MKHDYSLLIDLTKSIGLSDIASIFREGGGWTVSAQEIAGNLNAAA